MLLDTTDEASILVRVAKRLGLEERLRLRRRTPLRRGDSGRGDRPPGVQGNKYALAEVTLRIFNVFDVSAYRFLDRAEMLAAACEMALSRCRSSARGTQPQRR
jgi:hypothetical protein